MSTGGVPWQHSDRGTPLSTFKPSHSGLPSSPEEGAWYVVKEDRFSVKIGATRHTAARQASDHLAHDCPRVTKAVVDQPQELR